MQTHPTQPEASVYNAREVGPVNCWSRRVVTRRRFHAASLRRVIANLQMVWQRHSGTRNILRGMLISYPKWSC